MKLFFSGIQYLIDGFDLITKPGIKRFVVIPLLINIILFVGFFFALTHFITQFNTWFENYLPHWLQWLSYLLWILFFLSFILIFIYTFVTVANLISAPFNGFLAEKVEFFLTGHVFEERSLWDNIKDVPRILGRQCLILIYYVPRALFILILFFIPLIQTIAPILWILFNAWFLTMTFIDYPSDNHRVSLLKVRQWLRENRLQALGFGTSILMANMIPILNFFTMPAAVAGATKFWINKSRNIS